MSVHAARALIGWWMSSGSCHNYCVSLWKGVRTMIVRGFCIEVNVHRGGQKLAVQLQHGATLQSAAEVTRRPSLQKKLFNINIFSIVLSKKDTFLMFHYFYFYGIH